MFRLTQKFSYPCTGFGAKITSTHRRVVRAEVLVLRRDQVGLRIFKTLSARLG
jgi:hypothetical protein